MSKYLEHKTIDRFLKNTLLEKVIISDNQKIQLQKLLDSEVKLTSHDRRKTIYDFIINKVEDNWIERIIELRKLGARFHSLRHYELRYGSIIGKEKYEDKNIKSSCSLENYIFFHGKEKGTFLYNKSCEAKKGIATINKYIALYGEEKGITKWKEYQEKRKLTYKKKREEGYVFNNGRSLHEYIKKHGIEEGQILWQERNDKQSYRFSIDYYINKYGLELGMIEWVKYCNKMDKGSYLFFTNKYGLTEGTKKYEERINSIKAACLGFNLEKYNEKYGEELGKKILEQNIKKFSFNKRTVSKISQELFWIIYYELDEEKRKNVFFHELNEEKVIFLHQKEKKFFRLDFLLNKKIIEFNGTMFHSNEQQKISDFKRGEILKKLGFDILIITEEEYKKYKLKTVLKCLKYLHNV